MTPDKATLKLSAKKKEGPVFIADLDQLTAHLRTVSKRQIIFGGQLTMVALDPLKTQQGFVAQPPRTITGGLFSRSKTTKKLHLLLDKEVLDLLVKARKRPAFAVDTLLKYGLKFKGSEEHCVIGAIAASHTTQVLVLTFKKQELQSYHEYQLAHPSQNTYEADLHLLLERLRQNSTSAVFHWCGPVPAPKLHDFKTPDAAFWAATPAQALTVSGRPSFARQHGVSLGLVVLASAGYVGALYPKYQAYDAAKQELLTESASLRGDKAFNSERLSTLRSRQAFFEKQKQSEVRFTKFVDVLAAFAQQTGISVRSATLLTGQEPPAAGVGKGPDFEVLVEVRASAGEVSALDQGQVLLKSLSQKTHGNLRLATTGDSYREFIDAKGVASRGYRIQGDFPNAH